MKLFDLHEEKKASSGMALSKIVSYISRKIGVELLRIPGVEHFHNSKENGYGLR